MTMTPEEKQLLLKDLCARLPYGIIVHFHDINVADYDRQLIGEDLDFIELYLRDCKAYLRPMSSMTEEEEDEYLKCGFDDIAESGEIVVPAHRIDFLNAHHFDYRGLIEKGLALVAPEGMYK